MLKKLDDRTLILIGLAPILIFLIIVAVVIFVPKLSAQPTPTALVITLTPIPTIQPTNTPTVTPVPPTNTPTNTPTPTPTPAATLASTAAATQASG